MIHRRREAELVKPGLNIMWEPRAKGAILKTPWFSWYISWNRHTRRLSFAVPHGFNWRAPLGPWRKARELQADLYRVTGECNGLKLELDKVTRERNDFEFELSRACDRYDKVREMNTQLRDALSLYRNS